MRERLIELLKGNLPNFANDVAFWGGEHIGELADHLLANGVIVPPCKVGQKVYVWAYDEESAWIDEYKVCNFYCGSKGAQRIFATMGTAHLNFRPKDFGKTVFLTREEAEQALRGGAE